MNKETEPQDKERDDYDPRPRQKDIADHFYETWFSLMLVLGVGVIGMAVVGCIAIIKLKFF